MGPDVYIEHGSLNLNCMALLTISRSESISDVLNVVVTMCGISSLLRFDKETWPLVEQEPWRTTTGKSENGTWLILFTGTSQNCQLRFIKHEIKYGLERWAGFHTYIAKAEFCTNSVLIETTNCNSGWCWSMAKRVRKSSACSENGIAHGQWVVVSSVFTLLEATFLLITLSKCNTWYNHVSWHGIPVTNCLKSMLLQLTYTPKNVSLFSVLPKIVDAVFQFRLNFLLLKWRKKISHHPGFTQWLKILLL